MLVKIKEAILLIMKIRISDKVVDMKWIVRTFIGNWDKRGSNLYKYGSQATSKEVMLLQYSCRRMPHKCIENRHVKQHCHM